MSNFSVYREFDDGSTYISNLFIDEFLEDANAAQIKVYLYLLRTAGAATSVSDMADKFNYTEKDICRALKYWEKNHLLSLNYDIDGSVVGIQILPPSAFLRNSTGISNSVPVMTSSTPKELPFKNESSDKVDRFGKADHFGNPMDMTYQHDSVDAVIREAMETNPYAKPEYSADDLREFKEREETAQLIFIAEQYLCKTLSPSDIKSLLFISDVLGFSVDLIDYLLAYCADKDKKNFRYIETVAINWAEQGITTPAEAKSMSGRYDKSVYTVMRALGKDSAPTQKEADYVRRWTNEFGFSTDIIMEACERCVMSTDKNRFAYADSILKNWREAGVVTKKDIAATDAKRPKPAKRTDNSYQNNYMKHNYDYDEMEKILLAQD